LRVLNRDFRCEIPTRSSMPTVGHFEATPSLAGWQTDGFLLFRIILIHFVYFDYVIYSMLEASNHAA